MNPSHLIRRASLAGIALNVREGQLYAALPADPPPALIAALKTHKPTIITTLHRLAIDGDLFATTLAGVLYGETERWDVPLMVCRGFASETYLHTAVEVITDEGKPAWLYLMTDHDPNGLGIAAHVERVIRGFLPEHFPVTVERFAAAVPVPTIATTLATSARGFIVPLGQLFEYTRRRVAQGL